MRKKTREWLDDANDDMGAAVVLLQAGKVHLFVFVCTLVLEKLLKAAIIEKTGKLAPKIHRLRELAAMTGLRFARNHLALIRRLDGLSAQARYTDGRKKMMLADHDQLLSLMKGMEVFSKWIAGTISRD